ncbi:MAG: GNAT family N-acetyltransferase [Alphaproteobacteria bacterium]|nr:GNAT family N-acetyltransferase [Alphaproteobacteria bacterium]
MRVHRLVAGDDPDAAIDLLQRFFRAEGFTTPEDVIAANTRRMLALDSCAVLLAEDNGLAVGVATISMEFGIEYGWSAEMGDLFVLPEWRGGGVARLLVATAEDFLRARDAAGYQVTVSAAAEARHGLRHVYERLGFAGEGRSILHKRL